MQFSRNSCLAIPGIMIVALTGALACSADDVETWQTLPSDWEIRRLRTVDAEKAGGYPQWTVTQREDPPGVSITLAERDQTSRGSVMIGSRLTVPGDRMLRLAFSYTTKCAHEHRSGQLTLAIFDPRTWDSFSADPRTPQVNKGQTARPLWRWQVHSMSEPDVMEPTELDEDSARALSMALRTYAGQEVIIALSWTGAHMAVEGATLHHLRIEKGPLMMPEKKLIESLDLTNPELQGVAEAAQKHDYSAAVAALLQHFRKRWPEAPTATAVHRSRKDADMALENKFRSIGSDAYYTLREDFDWDRNAIDDKEWLLHLQWHDILVTLVTTASVTGDERYMAKVVDLIRDWIPRNYPGAPWSWRTLEVSLRAMKWARIYPYLLHDDGFSPADHAHFLLTLAAHLDFLLPEERFHSGHNFGATECKALLRVSLDFPEFRHAEEWRKTAWRRIESEMTDQVLPDGAQNELTCGYHNGVTNTFFNVAQWVQGTNLEPSETYWRQLEKMHEYTAYLTKPDGSQPNVGDTWSNHQGSLVERGGVFFKRPDLVFIGSHGVRGSRPDYLDCALPAAGYYAMRTSWPDDPAGIYLFFDAAKRWGGWHSHYDALGIILYAHGRTLTPDAGPFAYGNPLRDHFQSTAFHSTVCVDGANQNRNPCRVHAFHSDPTFSFADAEHPGYETVTHRRQILFVRPGHHMPAYVVLIDRLLGTGHHRLNLHVHLPPGHISHDRQRLTAATTETDQGNLRVSAVHTDGISLEPKTSWIMTGYGQKTDRPDICFTQAGDLPVLFVTLLVPFKGSADPKLEATLAQGSSASGPVAVTVTSQNGTRDLLFAGTDESANMIGDISWSGRAGLERQDETGKHLCRVLVGTGESETDSRGQ